MRLLRLLLPCALITGGATAAHAQEAAVGITPQAGYMFFGNHLEGPLGTSLRNAAGPMYGAQLALRIAEPVALIASGGYAGSDLQIGLPIVGGVDIASTSVWLADAGLELRLPTTGAVRPFVQGGVGIIRYEIETPILDIHATNPAFNAGVGVDLGIARGIGLRLLAKDYIGEFDFAEVTSFDIDGGLSHNFALTAGLRIGF